MISAWKKFINKTDGNLHEVNGIKSTNSSVPPGIQKLDKELQRKFARGVNYNMKIVIKGDTQVGKTSLFLRLKGYGFEDVYNPTESLNVTSINWDYKATDDIVKIDLWEAVDSFASKRTMNFVDLKMEQNQNKSQQQQPAAAAAAVAQSGHQTDNNADSKTADHNITITNTKLTMNGSIHQSPIPDSAKKSLALLSEHLDVYKGTDAVLLVMDMTKNWTFKYIQNELPKVPKHIPVLVVANHRDQGHHRSVSAEQVKTFIQGLDRSGCDGIVMYSEASMKNGFGLKLIERFFNIPFLKLQEAALLKQLELNRCDFMATLEELNLMEESTNREYEQYLELQTIKRRQQADAMSPVNNGLKQLDESTREQIRNATMSSETVDLKNAKSIESDNNNRQGISTAQQIANEKFVNHRLPSIVMGAKCPLPETKTIKMTSSDGISKTSQQSKTTNEPNDKSTELASQNQVSNEDESDEEDEEEIPRSNPLVANYQSDLDSDDQVESQNEKEKQASNTSGNGDKN